MDESSINTTTNATATTTNTTAHAPLPIPPSSHGEGSGGMIDVPAPLRPYLTLLTTPPPLSQPLPVCLQCRTAVLPRSLTDHLRKYHDAPAARGKPIRQLVAALPTLDFDTVALRPDGSLPLAALRIVDGFQCRHCRFIRRDVTDVRRHVNETHGVSATGAYREIKAQAWFGGRRAVYWRVGDESEGDTREQDMRSMGETRTGYEMEGVETEGVEMSRAKRSEANKRNKRKRTGTEEVEEMETRGEIEDGGEEAEVEDMGDREEVEEMGDGEEVEEENIEKTNGRISENTAKTRGGNLGEEETKASRSEEDKTKETNESRSEADKTKKSEEILTTHLPATEATEALCVWAFFGTRGFGHRNPRSWRAAEAEQKEEQKEEAEGPVYQWKVT